MATPKRDNSLATFNWEGKDKSGKIVRGEMRAASPTVVRTTLRRQGILVTKVSKQSFRSKGKVTDKDITLFTRQMATMMKSGVPLLQAFDIVGKGASNAAVGKLVADIKTDVETGSALNQAFRKFPLLFDNLYCNLVEAGEQAGILDQLLDRLATYKEKTQAIIAKIKSALFYPISVLVVAFIVTAVIMIFVVPQFKKVFTSFGADLPGPTLVVMAISDYFVEYWYIIFGAVGGGVYAFFYFCKTLGEDADIHGPAGLAPADLRRSDPQGNAGALDAHAVDHVRRRCTARRSAGFRRRRVGELHLP
jgi:type IV pilus assembly protein PilC